MEEILENNHRKLSTDSNYHLKMAFLSPRPNYSKKKEKSYVLLDEEKIILENFLQIEVLEDLEPKKIGNQKFQCGICDKIFKTKYIRFLVSFKYSIQHIYIFF